MEKIQNLKIDINQLKNRRSELYIKRNELPHNVRLQNWLDITNQINKINKLIKKYDKGKYNE